MSAGSAPMDLLTLVFYHECLLKSIAGGSSPVICFSIAILTGCPVALFLLKWADFMRTGPPLKTAVTVSSCMDDFCHWTQTLARKKTSTKMNSSHKNDTFLQEWHALSTASWPAKLLVLGAQLTRFACSTYFCCILLFSLLRCINGFLLFLLSITNQPDLICTIWFFVSGLSSHCLQNTWEALMKHKNVLICENNKHAT